jgi:hypothetical protein
MQNQETKLKKKKEGIGQPGLGCRSNLTPPLGMEKLFIPFVVFTGGPPNQYK